MERKTSSGARARASAPHHRAKKRRSNSRYPIPFWAELASRLAKAFPDSCDIVFEDMSKYLDAAIEDGLLTGQPESERLKAMRAKWCNDGRWFAILAGYGSLGARIVRDTKVESDGKKV